MVRISILLAFFSLILSCGANKEKSIDKAENPETSRAMALLQGPAIEDADFEKYADWQSVLPMPFDSGGHPGSRVNVYFNELAKSTFEEPSMPFGNGSVIVKERLNRADLPTGFIYIMKKKEETASLDLIGWQYGTARLDTSTGIWSIAQDQKEYGFCAECHNEYPEYFGVATIKLYNRK